METIAHRGSSGHAPGNTFEAIDLALEQGADVIEVDVRRVLGDELILWHDWYRETPLKLWDHVARYSCDELTRDAADDRVHRFSEVLEYLDGEAPLMIDVKGVVRVEETAEYIGEALEEAVETGNWEYNDFLVFSGNYKKIQWFAEEKDAVRRSYAMRPFIPWFVQKRRVPRAKKLGAEAMHLSFDRAKKSWVDRIHDENLDVYVWGANTEESITYLQELDVDGVITDYPDKAP